MSWRAFESVKRFDLLKIGVGWGDDTTTRRANDIFFRQRQCRLTKCVLEITGFRWFLEVNRCSYHTPELKLRHDKCKTVIFGPNMGINISKNYDAVLGTNWITIGIAFNRGNSHTVQSITGDRTKCLILGLCDVFPGTSVFGKA